MIGILDQVCDLQKEKKYQFIFENGNVLVIQQNAVYYHVILHYENDCIFLEWSNNAVFSGIVAYSLYETYGLPLEDTVDEVSRYGLTVDEKGFYILQEFHRQNNKGTFKNRNAFETGDQ